MKLISFWRLACFGICFLLWGILDAHAQVESSLKIKTDLCQMDFFQNSALKSDFKSNQQEWFSSIRRRDGVQSVISGTPVYLKVEILNISKIRQTVQFWFMPEWNPETFKYAPERQWLTLQLKKGKSLSIPQSNFLRLFNNAEGPQLSSTGGPERVTIEPGASYQEWICINSYFPLNGYGDHHLKTNIFVVRHNESVEDGIPEFHTGKEGEAIKFESDLTFRISNYHRDELAKSFEGYTLALGKTQNYSPLQRTVITGWLSFPPDIAFPAWKEYILNGNSSLLMPVLERSLSLSAANLDVFIASCEQCSSESRLAAMGILITMQKWGKSMKNPELTRYVGKSLEELDGKVPGVTTPIPKYTGD